MASPSRSGGNQSFRIDSSDNDLSQSRVGSTPSRGQYYGSDNGSVAVRDLGRESDSISASSSARANATMNGSRFGLISSPALATRAPAVPMTPLGGGGGGGTGGGGVISSSGTAQRSPETALSHNRTIPTYSFGSSPTMRTGPSSQPSATSTSLSPHSVFVPMHSPVRPRQPGQQGAPASATNVSPDQSMAKSAQESAVRPRRSSPSKGGTGEADLGKVHIVKQDQQVLVFMCSNSVVCFPVYFFHFLLQHRSFSSLIQSTRSSNKAQTGNRIVSWPRALNRCSPIKMV